MSKLNIIFGFVIALTLNNADALKGKCNKEEELHQRCSMALPVLSSPEISFALTREELDKSCVELRVGIKCIENFTEICMEKSEQMTFKKIYAGITEVVQELCTRGKYQDEYLRHAVCVKNVRSEYEVCSKKYEVTLTTLSNHQKKDQYNTDQTDVAPTHEDISRTVCCSFQEYLLCSELTVQRSCGDEAALFTSAFLKRMASNIIKNFCLEYRGHECGLSDKGTSMDHSILLITLALILVFSHVHVVLSSFQEYLLCSELTVQRKFGDEAALFTSAFLKRMASNIIKNFCLEYRGHECGLSDKGTSMDHSILLITLALILVFSHVRNFVLI